MITKTEKFLALYKEYEGIIRSRGIQNPKDAEENMEDADAQRMRMCRQFRNYISHNNDAGFLEPTDKMIDFINDMVNSLLMEEDIVKKHLKTASSSMCKSSDHAADALLKLSKMKRETIAVITEKGVSSYNIYDIITKMSKDKDALLSDIKPSGKVHFCVPTDRISELDRDLLYVCTASENGAGRILGTVIF